MHQSNTGRVMYYSENDMAFGFEYSKVSGRITELMSETRILMLADVLELIEINKYLDSPRAIEDHSQLIKKNKELIGRWMHEHKNQLVDEVRQAKLPYRYEDVLWDMIARRDLGNEIMVSLIKLYDGKRILFPLRQSKVVNQFGTVCCDMLIQNLENIVIVINSDSNGVHLPKEFTPAIRSKYFSDYIQSENPNPNYLESIMLDKSASQQTRMLAKMVYQQFMAKYFSENSDSVTHIEQRVLIDSAMPDNKDIEISSDSSNNTLKTTIRYNGRVLEDQMDWPSILNNFIYEFQMSDEFGILAVAPRREQEGVFERAINNNKPGQFRHETLLHTVITTHEMSFIAYYEFLQAKGIRLEDILEWFFEKYLVTNFNIKGLNISLPKDDDRDEIKPLLAMTQLHRIIRMYSLLALDMNFDRKLIDDISVTPSFSELSSVNEMKYASLSDQTLKNAENILFSDQSGMPTDENLSFGDAVVSGQSKKTDLLDFQLKGLELLTKNHILTCEEEHIKFTSRELYTLLKVDFQNGVIPYSRLLSYTKNHPVLDSMKADGKLKPINTLLTEEEASIFDYFFSDRFSNGKRLRNIYAHGADASFTKKDHVGNYMITLMFIVFLVIKINDDLDEQSRINRD